MLFEQVASLAGARTYTLTSSFRPTYNMATNLVRRCTPQEAHHLLNLSFAQYRADADIVRLESYLERSRRDLTAALRDATCELGDVAGYRRLIEGQDVRRHNRDEPRTRPAEVVTAMVALKPGDVLELQSRKPGGARYSEKVAVLSTSQRKGGDPSVRVVTAGRKLVSLRPQDFRYAPRAVGRVQLPAPFAPKERDFQRRVAAALAQGRDTGAQGDRRPGGSREQGDGAGQYREVEPSIGDDDEAPAQLSPQVASCPHLSEHLRAAARAERLARQVERLQKQVLGRSESLARQFDRVLALLQSWGYVDGWGLTAAGARLARIYHEQDLLVAECIERGALDGLRAPELAALASVFTFEARGPLTGEDAAKLPGRRVEERWRVVQEVASRLSADEEARGLTVTRPTDAGFVTLAHGWSRGKSIASLLAPPEAPSRGRAWTVSAGDFVRNVKQLTDLLRQLAEVLPDPASADAARQAASSVFRGVVAASSLVGTVSDGDMAAEAGQPDRARGDDQEEGLAP
jgi:ATP-dependent RNA helicase HelY